MKLKFKQTLAAAYLIGYCVSVFISIELINQSEHSLASLTVAPILICSFFPVLMHVTRCVNFRVSVEKIPRIAFEFSGSIAHYSELGYYNYVLSSRAAVCPEFAVQIHDDIFYLSSRCVAVYTGDIPDAYTNVCCIAIDYDDRGTVKPGRLHYAIPQPQPTAYPDYYNSYHNLIVCYQGRLIYANELQLRQDRCIAVSDGEQEELEYSNDIYIVGTVIRSDRRHFPDRIPQKDLNYYK